MRWVVPTVAAGATVFVVLQVGLAYYNLHVWGEIVARAIARFPKQVGSLHEPPTTRPLAMVAAGGLAVYGCFALAQTAIARRGHRLLWAIPPVAFVLLGAITSHGAPQTIGVPWVVACFRDCATPWYLGSWAGSIADLALVLVPGAVVAARMPGVRFSKWIDAPAAAALALCTALAVIVGRTWGALGHAPDLAAFSAVVALGLLVGTARPWWPWLHVAFAVVASGALAWFLSGGGAAGLPSSAGAGEPSSVIGTAGPFVVGVLAASAWEPLASVIRRSDIRPLGLLIAVNVLNLADAVLTAVEVHSGHALELNPLIRYGGLPLKVAVVGAISWLLYRRRPAALFWPAIVLLAVVCYHVSGFVVNWKI